jgi:hypothetical protein
MGSTFIHIPDFNSKKSEYFKGTFFHLKTVRHESGVSLKMVISFLRKVKACDLVMNVKSVL